MYDRQQRERENADIKRQLIAKYKTDNGCVDCGYSDHPAALEFDHMPGTEKLQTVASMMYYSWERIWAEVAKCELVCSNCHSIRTWKRKQG